MAVTLVQIKSIANVNPTSYTSNNTAGNLLIAFLRMQSGPTNVTDTQGNTWTQAASVVGGGSTTIAIYYVQNCKAGANTVTVNGGGQWFGAIAEYSGILTANAIDVTNVGSATSTAVNSGNITINQANELLVGVFNRDNATVTSPSMTQEVLVSFAACYDSIVSSTGTYALTCTISPSQAWGAAIASFKASASTGVPNSLAMLGCGI